MADPYTQAALIAAPFASLGKQMFQGQNMYEAGRMKSAESVARQNALDNHANLYGAQAQKAQAEAQLAGQRAQYQTPAFATKLAANLAGLSEGQGAEIADYQQRGNWGTNPGYDLPPDQDGPTMPAMPKSAPSWYSPQVEQRVNQARGVALGNLAATGNGKIDDMTKAFVSLLERGDYDASKASPAAMLQYAQSQYAQKGSAPFHQGNNGVMNVLTGAERLNDVGTSAALENRAQANSANASASNSIASRDLTRSKIGQGQTVTMPDGTQISTGAHMPKLTELQGKSQLFGSRAAEADRLISELEGKYSPAAINAKMGAEGIWGVGGALGAAGNAMLSKDGQKAEQAQRDFINAVLRLESGAVIGAEEFDNAKKQYFPQPNDSKEVLRQKSTNRKTAIEGLKVMAGPASGLINYGGPSEERKRTLLKDAKDAIDKGADRDAVIKELKAQGVDGGAI